jgi:hypothetical protein
MQIELTIPESEYLKQVLDTARTSLLHEMHHAHAHEFKDVLKQQLDLNEKVLQKIEPAPAPARG